MIHFILAGMLYLGIMFVVAFSLSFVTIGISFSVATCVKRCFMPSRTRWVENR